MNVTGVFIEDPKNNVGVALTILVLQTTVEGRVVVIRRGTRSFDQEARIWPTQIQAVEIRELQEPNIKSAIIVAVGDFVYRREWQASEGMPVRVGSGVCSMPVAMPLVGAMAPVRELHILPGNRPEQCTNGEKPRT